MELPFFGLTPEDRSLIFTQIHEIVFYGQGGYTWETVYDFPLWLRRFTYSKLVQHYTKKKDESEDVVEQTRKNIREAGYAEKPKKQINTPDYVMKASKKQ